QVGLLEERVRLDVLHEVRDRVRVETAAFDADQAAAHRHLVEPNQIGKVLADLIHDADGTLLAQLELIDQIDAFLQAVLAPLVVLDFLDDRFQALRLAGLDLHGLAAVGQLAVLDEPPAGGDHDPEDQTADDENAVEVG